MDHAGFPANYLKDYAEQKGSEPHRAGICYVREREYPSNHGCMSGGTSVLILNAKESPTGKAVTVSVRKIAVLRHCGGWRKVG